MLITTTQHFEGATICDYHGLVSGQCVAGVNVIRDIMTRIRDFFGGRSGSYETVLAKGREEAIEDMIQRAKEAGANAIIGVSIQIQGIGKEGMLLIAATGTAVTVSA